MNSPHDQAGRARRHALAGKAPGCKPDPAWSALTGLRHSTRLLCGVLFSVVLWTFLPAVDHSFVVYDDPDYVTDNAQVRAGLTWGDVAWAFKSGESANWHPLTWMSHQLDCQLYGTQPWGHHLTSVLIHSVNACLVFLLFRRLTGSVGRSFAVAALFGLHPLRVESVAWVAERKDVLGGMFFLLTLLLYAGYAQKRMSARAGPRRADTGLRDYGLALATYALGLMSKPMLVTLPFVMLLLDYWPLRRGENCEVAGLKSHRSSCLPPSLWLEKVPFFVLALASATVTFRVQKSGGAVIAVAFHDRVQNALVAYVRYLAKLAWPVDLSVFYPYPKQWGAGAVIGAALVLGAISAAGWFERRRAPWFLMGWGWFVGMLVPVIGLVQAGEQSLADRYSYLPSIGVNVAVVWTLAAAALRCGGLRRLLPAAAAIVIALNIATARHQFSYWKDSESLFRHAIAVTTGNYLAHLNVGTSLDRRGQLEAAAEEYLKALEDRPNYSEALANLGAVRGRQGRSEEAIQLSRQALALNPAEVVAWNNLGCALTAQGQWKEAISSYRRAIAIKPGYADAHFNLASALVRQGSLEEAIREFRRAVALQPEASDAHNALGLALDRQGQLDEAIDQFEMAWRLEPGSVDIANNLAVALGKRGRLDDAIRVFEWCIRSEPTAAKFHFNLGVMLAQAGRLDDAAAEFREALKIEPDYGEARTNLDQVIQLQGNRKNPAPPERRP